jgi:hypothetical protein
LDLQFLFLGAFAHTDGSGDAHPHGTWPLAAIRRGVQFGSIHLHELVLFGVVLFTVYAAPLAWLILVFFRPFRISWRVHLSQALAYALGWALILTGEKWDPTPFTNWLFD